MAGEIDQIKSNYLPVMHYQLVVNLARGYHSIFWWYKFSESELQQPGKKKKQWSLDHS
jgi:hypothetical protein